MELIWNKSGEIFDHDLYLKCDVLLLADVFKKIINSSIKNYGLYLSRSLSAPVLSLHAMLNMTRVKLELISDCDIDAFFGKGMRGGVSYISNAHNKANNEYLKSYGLKQ